MGDFNSRNYSEHLPALRQYVNAREKEVARCPGNILWGLRREKRSQKETRQNRYLFKHDGEFSQGEMRANISSVTRFRRPAGVDGRLCKASLRPLQKCSQKPASLNIPSLLPKPPGTNRQADDRTISRALDHRRRAGATRVCMQKAAEADFGVTRPDRKPPVLLAEFISDFRAGFIRPATH